MQSYNKVKEAFLKPIETQQLKIDPTPVKKNCFALEWIGIGWVRKEKKRLLELFPHMFRSS